MSVYIMPTTTKYLNIKLLNKTIVLAYIILLTYRIN